MSEQPNQPDRPEDEGAQAGAGGDVEQPGGGVTEGETTVDEAVGGQDDPGR